MIPYSVCGMWTDYGTHQFKCRARLWSDRPDTVEVYYLYAPPDAEQFPGLTHMIPLPWRAEAMDTFPVGPVAGTLEPILGRPPRVQGDGKHYHGKLDWFRTGKPWDDGPNNLPRNKNGEVLACLPRGLMAGGAEAFGEAAIMPGQTLVMTGWCEGFAPCSAPDLAGGATLDSAGGAEGYSQVETWQAGILWADVVASFNDGTGEVDWTDPSNAEGPPSTDYASITANGAQVVGYDLRASWANLADIVPAGATLVGLDLALVHYADPTSASTRRRAASYLDTQLIAQRIGPSGWPTSQTTLHFGAPGVTWGLTGDDVRGDDFFIHLNQVFDLPTTTELRVVALGLTLWWELL